MVSATEPGDDSELEFPTELSVGSRIRHRRLALRKTLKATAQQAGISESYLSLIERGRGSPSVKILSAISKSLRIPTRHLFSEDRPGRAQVLRIEELDGRAFGDGASKRVLTPDDFRFLEVLMGTFPPGTSTGEEPYTHGDSEELLIVLEGTYEMQLADRTLTVSAGECIGYRSDVPHKLVSTSGTEGRVLWIVAPLSY